MPISIRTPFNAFNELEKRLKYKFWDKERERSNRAAKMADDAKQFSRPAARCPMRHDQIAWSGPPHDAIQAYVCLRCNAAACEPEIKDRGHDFATVPDWIIDEILDLDLQRQAQGNPKMFGVGV